MAFQFKPAVFKSESLYELPRPIRRVQIQERWDAERFKVLHEDGDQTHGQTRQGVDITLSGEIGAVGGQLKLTEVEMFASIEQLRTILDTDDDEKFSFFLYHDEPTETYRFFKDCTVTRFSYDLSRTELFTYTVQIHADHPELQSTFTP